MTPRPIRGFTLVELLIAMVLFTLVGGSIYRVLVSQQQLARAQQEQVSLQTNVRTGVLLLSRELREIASGGSSPDILRMAADSITYRAMRATAVACQVSPGEVRIRATPFYGFRQPQAGRDSLLLFVENDSSLSSDDRWLALPITNVTNGTMCGLKPAVSLTINPPIDTTVATGTPLTRIRLGAPARTFEVMQIALFQSAGQYWLGARSVSAGEAIQPVLGPLTSNGLTLSYLDSTGAVTAIQSRVRSVRATVRGITDRTVRTGQAGGQLALLQDSLVTQVGLRNAPGF